MKNMRDSIRQLLGLQRPLPKSLSDEIRVGQAKLLKMQDEFLDIASELRVWTFYETIDSDLSGSGGGRSSEVQFGAPLVSIKSALLDLRHEDVFAVESDHAHVASFGPDNVNTMRTFLEDFAAAISKARKLSAYMHSPLRLKEPVKVEVIGFYEDPDAEMESAIRLYATRYHLNEFLDQGPERCLAERLARMSRRHAAFGSDNAQQALGSRMLEGSGGLSVRHGVQKTLAMSQTDMQESTETGPGSPDITVTSASARPSLNLPRRPYGSSAPVLATTATRPPSSESEGSTSSTVSEPALQLSSIDVASFPKAEASDKLELVRQREEFLSKAGFVIRDPAAGFSRPDPNLRKFMWIHAPFTNPIWVRVRKQS